MKKLLIALLLMFAIPALGVAKSFTEGKRYICETTQATGWDEEGKYTDLDLTDPETQYIIEPMIMTVKEAKYAEEGYIEHLTSHTVKQLGNDDLLAVCGRSYNIYQMNCYDTYGDLNNKIALVPNFIIHTTGSMRENIFMTRLNFTTIVFPVINSDHDNPVLEVGECKKF
jgi:hypothetical protein